MAKRRSYTNYNCGEHQQTNRLASIQTTLPPTHFQLIKALLNQDKHNIYALLVCISNTTTTYFAPPPPPPTTTTATTACMLYASTILLMSSASFGSTLSGAASVQLLVQRILRSTKQRLCAS